MPRPNRARVEEGEKLRHQLRAAQRLLKVKKARDSLIDFTELTMPHPEDPDDATRSRYEAQNFHHALARALEAAESGKYKRLIITMPPRHGKSQLTTRQLPGWLVGRDPYRSVMVATYNQPFAEDFGRDVRAVMQGQAFAQVFPECTLRKGSQASDRLQTEQGGLLAFVGRGGSITGRGADFFIIDDPLKNRQEADSALIRDELWKWYNDDVMTRMMTDEGVVLIITTRWHEDDLVGRLTDPTNPHYVEDEAKQWKIINIAAIARMYGADDEDPLGREPGEVLWPGRFSREYLEAFRRRNPLGFASLYQQTPTAADGDMFRRDMIVPYGPNEMPKSLRMYTGSDHAVTTKQSNDASCLLTAGVDEHDDLWLMPDIFWGRKPTDFVVEEMLRLNRLYKPLVWWAESGHISKSIGPFLRKRMLETRNYINIQESPSHADKAQKAQPAVARMAMKKIRFPNWVWWYTPAIQELMKFPNGRLNDFVDALAIICMGLDRMIGAERVTPRKEARPGTMGWIKQETRRAAEEERRRYAFGG
jgi:hypothetical protein